MKTSQPEESLDAPADFQAHAKKFIETLVEKQKTVIYPPIQIEPVFHEHADGYCSIIPSAHEAPVYNEKSGGNHFRLHIHQNAMLGMPALTVEGWLAREVVLCVQKMQPEFFAYSYLRQIYPIWPVVGLAENHLRELIYRLEIALKDYLAAQAILRMKLGAALVFYCLDVMRPTAEDAAQYRQTIPHSWTRALYVCRILKDYMLVELLSRQGIEFSRELEKQWHQFFSFIMPEDLLVLNLLAEVPVRYPDAEYGDLLAELFTRLKNRMLENGGDSPETPGTLH